MAQRRLSSAASAEVIPRALYPNAVTWRSSTWQLAAVLGPALGGLIYGFGSATAAYTVNGALVLAALLSIARIRHAPPARAPSEGSVLESLGSGVRFVWGLPIVLGALALDLFSVLFGGATGAPAGTGLLRERDFHRELQRNRRLRVGRGETVGHGTIRGVRRPRDAARGGRDGAAGAGAAEAGRD